MLAKNIYNLFCYISIVSIFVFFHFSLVNILAVKITYTEEVYLDKQSPVSIGPEHEIKSTFNFPELILKNEDIKPVEKKYHTRRIIPKSNLD